MLVLTRTPGETIIIETPAGEHIQGVKGNQVRVGIEAPETVAILREELALRDSTD